MDLQNEKKRGIELLERALEIQRRMIGLAVRIVEHNPAGYTGYKPDALIEIEVEDRKPLQFLVEVKQIDRFELVTQIRTHRPVEAQPPLLLVAPYITAETAERCRNLKLFFLDEAGHAYIDVPGLYVLITGNKRPADLAPAKRGRIANPAALKVIFAILCRPQLLAGNYREIAEAARVALGTVGPVIKDLEARKHLVTFGTVTPAPFVRRPETVVALYPSFVPAKPGVKIEGRKLVDAKRLLEEWVAFYPIVLRPKLNARRFRGPNANWAEKADLRKYEAYWGAEIAAQRITQYLQPVGATIYILQQPMQLIAAHHLRADIRGDVEILDVFWNPDKIPHEPDIVPPILTYADLMATTEGRNLEVAKLIYDEHIAPNLHRTV